MPGTYSKNKFDIADLQLELLIKKIINQNNIKINDLILAVPSSGVHSNGYSLIRYILKKKINLKNKYLKNELMKPTQNLRQRNFKTLIKLN